MQDEISSGFFIITDITGYTMFLTESELDHAHHIIQALFDSQLKVISAPMHVSNFQGDAILCYVPDATLKNSKKLMEQIEGIYKAFSDQITVMQINPPCGCTACSNMDVLDLKIFLHHGKYLVKTVGERDEILGSDVITAHRMMKNDVVKQTGIHSYLLMTKTARDKLAIDVSGMDLVNYTQNYEHIGEVEMFVSDLGPSHIIGGHRSSQRVL